MQNFENGKIYKLISNLNDDVYYGSTCKTLKERLSRHLSVYRQFKKGNRKSCPTSKLIFETEDFDIVLVENFPCANKKELLGRERFWIETNKCVNKYIPTRTGKEYQKSHPEQRRATAKRYEDTHKDKKREYRVKNKEHIKEYFRTNKEKLKEQRKEYCKKHKEELRAKSSKHILCKCGITFTHAKRSRHEKSRKHQTCLYIAKEIEKLNNLRIETQRILRELKEKLKIISGLKL